MLHATSTLFLLLNIFLMSHHFIKFKDVKYHYHNGYEALKGISFYITHSEKVALEGSNGAGKSTIVLHTNGLLLHTSGEINIGDIPLVKKTLSIIRQNVGIVFQNPDDQLFMPIVEEDVAFGPMNMKLPFDEVEKRVTEALKAVGAENLRKRSCYQLSGGQKRSVAIATVLSMEPSILVMNEPTSNLDPKARRQIINLIKSFSHTCLIATHDMEMVWDLCERTIMIKDGKVLADGETRILLTDKYLVEQCGLEIPYSSLMELSFRTHSL